MVQGWIGLANLAVGPGRNADVRSPPRLNPPVAYASTLSSSVFSSLAATSHAFLQEARAMGGWKEGTCAKPRSRSCCWDSRPAWRVSERKRLVAYCSKRGAARTRPSHVVCVRVPCQSGWVVGRRAGGGGTLKRGFCNVASRSVERCPWRR